MGLIPDIRFEDSLKSYW